MKIVHVVRQYLPSVGGMEEVVRSLAARQTASGLMPRVLTLDRVFRERDEPLPAGEVIDGVPVQRLAFRGSERYPLAPAVAGAIADADLVHVHGIDFFFDYLAATRWLHRKPLVASTHGGFFHTAFASGLKQVYFNTVTRLSSRAYGRIIATSTNDGALFGKVVSPNRLRVIENGVDVTKFRDAASPMAAPVLVYFGRWSVNKGLLETIDLFAALCRQAPDTPWRLLIAGREYDLNSADLEHHAARAGVLERVELVPNPSQSALRQLLGRASYFVCLSRHEGFGIAPIEAMSAGLTPLLSDIPPFRRLIEHTGRGLLCRSGELAAAAARLAAYHAGLGGDYQAVVRANRDSVDEYDWHGVHLRYLSCYREVLAETSCQTSPRAEFTDVKE